MERFGADIAKHVVSVKCLLRVGPMDSFHKLFSNNYREQYKEPDFDPLVSPLVKNNNTDYDEIKEIALKKLR